MKNVKHIARGIYRFLLLWFVDTISLMGTAVILPGITIQSSGSYPIISVAASAALVLGIINFLIRPLILLLAVPFGMIVVFLIGFFVNAIALVLTSNLMSPAFQVDGWLTAFIGGLIFSAINTILTGLMTVDDEGSFYQGLVERLAKRKMFPDAETDERGLVMMEIDGLSYHHIQKAIEDGWMPNLSEMIENDGYILSRVDCGLPSQTSACQSGIMFGDNHDIPAFRWFDKDLNRMVVSSHDSAMINARYAHGQGLMRGGSSINNMMNGDAHKSLLTLADITSGDKEEKKQRARDIYLLMLNPYFFTRTLIFFFGDVILEIWQGFQQRIHNVEPRLNRLHKGYPFMRAGMTIFMRDVAAYLAVMDIIRGTPSLYITWPGYDEVAHHSGPWTKDAFGTLRQYDRVIGRIRDTIAEKAPRPYELVLLSDHGQSFGATFLQRYGYTLKEFIEQNMPQGTEVVIASGGDDGTIGMTAMAGELKNIQDQEMAGKLGNAVMGGAEKAINQGVEMQTVELEPAEPANVTVCGSGNIAQVYFDLYPRKITLSELNSAYTGMVEALVQHEGIGFVGAYADDGTPIVLGKNGSRNLHAGEVSGEDPLEPYGDVDLRAMQVRRIADFPHAGDLIVNSTLFPDGTVAAMEELIGNHGGLGGEQTDAFMFHPADMPVPETNNSADVFAILNNRRGLTGPPAKPEESTEEAVDAWSLGTISKGLSQVGKWLGLAGRALVLETSAYQEIAHDIYMTAPAVLLGMIGSTTASVIRMDGFQWESVATRILAWLVSVVLVFLTARLLGGKGTFTATLRGLGFAQFVYVLDLLAFIPVVSDIVRVLVAVLAFFAAWIAAVAAHELKGWRSIILPLMMIGVLVLSIFILGTLAEGFAFTLESLGVDFGLISAK